MSRKPHTDWPALPHSAKAWAIYDEDGDIVGIEMNGVRYIAIEGRKPAAPGPLARVRQVTITPFRTDKDRSDHKSRMRAKEDEATRARAKKVEAARVAREITRLGTPMAQRNANIYRDVLASDRPITAIAKDNSLSTETINRIVTREHRRKCYARAEGYEGCGCHTPSEIRKKHRTGATA